MVWFWLFGMVKVKTGFGCEGNTHRDPVSAIFVPVRILVPICHEQQALYDDEIVVFDIKVVECLILLAFHSQPLYPRLENPYSPVHVERASPKLVAAKDIQQHKETSSPQR